MISRLDPIKPGDTFAFYLDFAIDGVAEDFSVSELAATVRDRNGSKLSDMTITAVAGVVGRFLAQVPSVSTALWPEGEHYCDVKRTSSGVVMHSDTLIVPLWRAQTK